MSDPAILINFAIPHSCPARSAAVVKSRMRHSWLENEILNCDPPYVQSLRTSVSQARTEFESMIGEDGTFGKMIQECRQFCRTIVDDLSPRHLVEIGSLAKLPSHVRSAIASTLHQIYLAQSNIQKIQTELTGHIDAFDQAFQRFATVWYDVSRDNGTGEVRSAFECLQREGRHLHRVLGRLPEGTVLP